MPRVDLTFRCFISPEQLEQMRQLQDIGEFGTKEAVELIEAAYDAALVQVGDFL